MRKMYLEKLTLLIIILTKEFRTNSGQCGTHGVLFESIGSSPVFDYRYFITRSGGPSNGTVSFLSPKKVTLFVVTYSGGTVFMQPVYNNCSLAIGGNISAGILKIQLNPLKTGQEGDYIFQDETTGSRCSGTGGTYYFTFTLFIYGVPTQPTIDSNTTDAYEGMSVVLTCSSTSTTVPRDWFGHYLKMTYEWRRDGSIVSTEGRFTVEQSIGRKITISNINRDDERYSFSCRAKEQGGNSSVLSSLSLVYRLTIGYGPDSVTLSPPSTSYTLNDNQPINDIICSATCYPVCTYVWTKSGGGTVGTTNGVLSLGTLHRSEAGTYWCTPMNAAGSVNSSSLTINVVYGPDSVTLTPSNTSYTMNENEFMNDITCSASCVPDCMYTWAKTEGGTVSTTNVLSLRTLQRGEAGSYNCTARNPQSSASANSQSVSVVVRCKPSSPEALNFTVIQGTVYFNWKRGFNGGHPQTFIVQLSKDSLDNYINHTTISEEGSFNTNDMVTVKVTNLDEGVYHARLRTFNAIGAAEPEVFGVFTITKVSDGTESTSSATTGAIAGGIIGSLCGIIVIGLAVVAVMRYEIKCIRRQVLCDGHSGSRQNETSQCEGNGTDLNNQAYESLDVGQCKAIYTSLSQQAGHDNPRVYDNSEINAEEAV